MDGTRTLLPVLAMGALTLLATSQIAPVRLRASGPSAVGEFVAVVALVTTALVAGMGVWSAIER